jgi:hypothetical protein
MTEKEFRRALRKNEKLTLWKTRDGYQANAFRDGASGWLVSVDENPLEALKNVLGLNPEEDKFDDLA